ncbi:MAG: hypothetical protein ACTIKR_19140, partial [Advenella sp.]|uniref:hypothetical protein n=1 Tax=Advenella sp. TaxID=1872388 RepID=UPI003F9E61FC
EFFSLTNSWDRAINNPLRRMRVVIHKATGATPDNPTESAVEQAYPVIIRSSRPARRRDRNRRRHAPPAPSVGA